MERHKESTEAGIEAGSLETPTETIESMSDISNVETPAPEISTSELTSEPYNITNESSENISNNADTDVINSELKNITNDLGNISSETTNVTNQITEADQSINTVNEGNSSELTEQLAPFNEPSAFESANANPITNESISTNLFLFSY